MYVKMEISKDDLWDKLWSGAKQRWYNATDEQRDMVWDLVEDTFSGEIPTITELNDLIWFGCDDIFNEDEEEIDEAKIRRSCKKDEELKTDYSGGFTDCMKAVDAMLEKYYDEGQVETLVTDNGIATITVFPQKGGDETITIQLDYPHNKAMLVDDQNHSKTVSVDVDKTDFDKLGKAVIELVDSQLKVGESKKPFKKVVKRPMMRKSNISHI